MKKLGIIKTDVLKMEPKHTIPYHGKLEPLLKANF
jgi:hypothetical protein